MFVADFCLLQTKFILRCFAHLVQNQWSVKTVLWGIHAPWTMSKRGCDPIPTHLLYACLAKSTQTRSSLPLGENFYSHLPIRRGHFSILGRNFFGGWKKKRGCDPIPTHLLYACLDKSTQTRSSLPLGKIFILICQSEGVNFRFWVETSLAGGKIVDCCCPDSEMGCKLEIST